MKLSSSFIILITFIFLFQSCATRKHTVSFNNRNILDTTTVHSKNKISYKIKSGDILYVKILSINEDIDKLFSLETNGNSNYLSNTSSSYIKGYFVNEKGDIKLPVIDTIHIAGLSLDSAEVLIQKRVNDYFNNATLIIKLLNFHISVLGEVNSPGQFDIFYNGVTLLDAIAKAGGITQYGDKKHILLIRNYQDEIVTTKLDLTDINILDSDHFFLQPGDVIMVQPVKLKNFRLNAPTITLIATSITTLVLMLNFAGVGNN